MELVVIRHGETQANAEGRYQGALDIGLNDDGVRQISCLVSWDCLWSLCLPFVSGMSACLKG